MSTARRPGGPPRRAMIRWSWRMFRKEWRQQLLVLGLVTISVAIAVAGSTMAMNAADAVQPGFGTAGAMARLPVEDDARAAEAVATARARFGTVEVIGHTDVAIPGAAQPLDLRSQDPDGRFGHTMLALRDGRYPTKAGEVGLTPGAARLLDVGLGDRVRLGRTERTVVGIVENPTGLGDDFALAPADGGRGADSLTLLFPQPGSDGASAGRAPSGGGDPQGLQIPVAVRGDNGPIAALVLVAVALAMTLVGFIAASGFVVVAQRRQRQLGLLAAIGATQRHTRLVVVANGAIVGIVAGLLGTALGIVGWVLGAPAVEEAAGRRIDRFDLPWPIIGSCLAVAVLMSLAAAWWPARRMSRIPIIAALAGRPPLPAPVHRSLLVAVVLLGGGVVAISSAMPSEANVRPLLLIAGVVAVAIGTVFVAPAAIRLGAAPAARLPLASRLALRDLARFEARAAAALAAIAFVVGISVTVVAIAGANQYRSDEGNLSDHQVLVSMRVPQATTPSGPNDAQIAALDRSAARVAATIAGAEMVPLDVVRRATPIDNPDPGLQEPISVAREVGSHSWTHLAFPPVATPELLAHFGIDPATIRPGTDLLGTDTRDVTLLDIAQRDQEPTKVQHVDLPGYTAAPRWLVTEAALERHGWVAQRSAWLIDAPHALDADQIAAARATAADAGLVIEVRSSQDGLASLRAIATGVGALLALAIVAMTVGLIRSESARDLRTLTATGAPSRTRRSLTGVTAGALAVLGVVLGTAGAYAALAAGYHHDLSRLTPVPWPHLLIIAVGLPLLAATAGWLLAGREPKGFSRQTFD